MSGVMESLTQLVLPLPIALVPLANDCEDMEVAAIYDVLTQGRVRVVLADVASPHQAHLIQTMQGVQIQADQSIKQCEDKEFDVIVVPGGTGAQELAKSEVLLHLLRQQKASGKWLAGISSGVVKVLHHHALLDGEATCDPLLADQLGTLFRPERVVVSGKCITSQGPHTALDFGLKIVEALRGKHTAQQLSHSLLVRRLEP